MKHSALHWKFFVNLLCYVVQFFVNCKFVHYLFPSVLWCAILQVVLSLQWKTCKITTRDVLYTCIESGMQFMMIIYTVASRVSIHVFDTFYSQAPDVKIFYFIEKNFMYLIVQDFFYYKKKYFYCQVPVILLFKPNCWMYMYIYLLCFRVF